MPCATELFVDVEALGVDMFGEDPDALGSEVDAVGDGDEIEEHDDDDDDDEEELREDRGSVAMIESTADFCLGLGESLGRELTWRRVGCCCGKCADICALYCCGRATDEAFCGFELDMMKAGHRLP